MIRLCRRVNNLLPPIQYYFKTKSINIKYIYRNRICYYMDKNMDETPVWSDPVVEHLKNNPDKTIFRTGLKVFNSLTGKKNEFVTASGTNVVKWYMCGPTVYDASHLGHARTYLTFDIIRKIMTNYFHYDIDVSYFT